MKVRINTFDGLTWLMEVHAEWRVFLEEVMKAGWVGCDGYWSALANVRSLMEIKEQEHDATVLPFKPALVEASRLTDWENVP
jgi:hypothetical protein